MSLVSAAAPANFAGTAGRVIWWIFTAILVANLVELVVTTSQSNSVRLRERSAAQDIPFAVIFLVELLSQPFIHGLRGAVKRCVCCNVPPYVQ